MISAVRKSIILLAAVPGLLFACGHMPEIHVVKDSLSPQERLNLGVAYEASGDYEAALEAYELASSEPELKGVALLYKGNTLYKMGKTVQAEMEYKKAMKAAPGLAGAYNNLAWLYCSMGRNLDEAEKLAQYAFDLTEGKDPNVNDTLSAVRAALDGRQGESGGTPCAP